MRKRICKGVGVMALTTTMALGAADLRVNGMSGTVVSTEQPALVLTYDKPAEDWESEALPLGNGFIGAMVFGGVASEHIQVNEKTLWSGGPGANEDYNGGQLNSAEENKLALQNVRRMLQDKMTAFTENDAAYIDEDTGLVVAKDYAPEDAELRAEINKLVGDKSNFGSYQTLGNILISDQTTELPQIVAYSGNCEPENKNEGLAMLFDGSDATKWYSGAGMPDGHTQDLPYIIDWEYSEAFEANGFSLTSGNDVPERDPKSFDLFGSNDGQTYDLIEARENVSFSNRKEMYYFTFSNTVNYKYYRLLIHETLGGMPCQLSDIRVIGANEQQAAAPQYENYTRELDIDNAVMHVGYTLDGVNYSRNYFISNPDNIMVIELTADQSGKLTKTIEVTSEQSKKTITSENGTITMQGQPADQKEWGLRFAQQVKVIANGGETVSENGKVYVTNADSILIIMSAGTNYVQSMDDNFNYFSSENPLTAVTSRVEAAAQKSYGDLLQAHTADYKALYDRVKLSLGAAEKTNKTTDRLLAGYIRGEENGNTAAEDRYLEILYYQYGRYLLIGSSREGSLPANLQGIWAEGLNPPWASDYHTNINLQMNYWLAQQTNLAECHLPVIEYVKSLVPRGEIMAQNYYVKQDGGDVRGWVIHHENNIWGNAGPGNYYEGFYFPAAAAWMCQDIWEYYTFTKDEAFLSENYDVLLSAALFWVDNLWVDERDGTLVSNPSYSPEHGAYSLGASADQEIIWELFTQVIKASEILNKTSSELDEVKTALSKLYIPQIGLAGQFMEWKDEVIKDITGDGQHRHVNHLFALHPGTMVVVGRSEEDDIIAEAMKKTLITRGDGGTGWSKAWKINFWARLRDGEHSHLMVKQLITQSTLQNLFDTHPPFQIDGNFGATAGMTEMLIQSQGDSIDLLPAISADWSTGSVNGLVARGAFEVAMSWSDSRLNALEILSSAGEDCTLSYPGLANAFVMRADNNQKVNFTSTDTDTISFPTESGVAYVLSYTDNSVEPESTDTADTTEPTDTDAPSEPTESPATDSATNNASNAPLIIGIVAGVLAVTVGLTAFLLNKRKK